MKYGLFIYEHSHNNLINIGDYVQSIAARQFLPQVDVFIDRDRLSTFKNEEKVKLIMNGWFGYNPENWPPSEAINPLFVSYHLNKNIALDLMNNREVVEYFKKHEKIGCRDNNTAVRMKEVGIDAYYSCCLTTTLNYNNKLFNEVIKKTDEILLVDVLFKEDIAFKVKRNKLYLIQETLRGNIHKYNKISKYINNLIPPRYNDRVKKKTCYYTAKSTQEERFNAALELLKQLATSKIVVTSRIHIALPCLALGTPVLFVLGKKLANPDEFKRLDGIVNHMNILVDDDFKSSEPHLKDLNFYKKSEIDWDNPPKNPSTHVKFRDQLIERVTNFINTKK